MGYGFPGAVGAQIGNPETPVIMISGDGGMQMNIQELATAVLEELPIISCIFNNTVFDSLYFYIRFGNIQTKLPEVSKG